MTLYRKVRAVERVFRQLEKDVASFQHATGLKCASQCGLCCKKPDINATVIEFLPLAYHLFKLNKAEEKLFHLLENPENQICQNLSPFLLKQSGGFCGAYAYRGLICRLFGFSAMLDKNGAPQLVTCKIIKEGFPEEVNNANHHISLGKKTPVMRNYYFQLTSIDPYLGNMLPINKAMAEALKVVLAYYAYRKPGRTG